MTVFFYFKPKGFVLECCKTYYWWCLNNNLLRRAAPQYTKAKVSSTAKNTVISPDFLVWEFCRQAQFLHRMRKLCLSAKFPHQEIRWNYDIFRSIPSFKIEEYLILWKNLTLICHVNLLYNSFFWIDRSQSTQCKFILSFYSFGLLNGIFFRKKMVTKFPLSKLWIKTAVIQWITFCLNEFCWSSSPDQKYLITPERQGVFSWNFGEISMETFWHPEVWNWKTC